MCLFHVRFRWRREGATPVQRLWVTSQRATVGFKDSNLGTRHLQTGSPPNFYAPQCAVTLRTSIYPVSVLSAPQSKARRHMVGTSI